MKLTRQQAINANCKECIYDPANGGTVLAQIEACTVVSCPLYDYRPVTAKTNAVRLAERKKSFTPEQEAAYNRKVENARKIRK